MSFMGTMITVRTLGALNSGEYSLFIAFPGSLVPERSPIVPSSEVDNKVEKMMFEKILGNRGGRSEEMRTGATGLGARDGDGKRKFGARAAPNTTWAREGKNQERDRRQRARGRNFLERERFMQPSIRAGNRRRVRPGQFFLEFGGQGIEGMFGLFSAQVVDKDHGKVALEAQARYGRDSGRWNRHGR